MADRAELMDALRHADAAGDTAAATAIARRLSSQPEQPQVRTNAPAVEPEKSIGDHALEFGGNFAKGLAGSLGSVGSNIIGVATAAPRALARTLGVQNGVTDYLDRIPEAAKWMRNEAKGVGGFLGEATGDIAATAGIGGIGLKAARLLPMAQRAVTPFLAAAASGAASGAYTAPTDHAKAALIGAAGSAAGQQILSRTLGRLANPVSNAHHADAEVLMQNGVPMTVGLAADPNTLSGRAMRFLEESAASVPFLGAGVKAQREAARAGFRDLPMREVAEAAKVSMPARSNAVTTADMLDELGGNIGTRYETLLNGRTIRPTRTFMQNLQAAVMDPKLGMTPANRQRAQNLVQAHIWDRAKDPASGAMPNVLDMPALFRAQSDLRQLGNKSMRSDLSDESAYGKALTRSADEVYDFIRRRFPQTGQELTDLRAPYAKLSTLEAAANKAGARGEFTPAQLGQVAVKRGDQEMRHLAAMAEPLITKDPGTIGAAARTALLTGSSALVGPASIPMGVAAHLLLGTRTGQKGLTGQLGWQQKLADLLVRRAEDVNRVGSVVGRETALQANE